MALLHRATLRPTKLDLLTAWLPSQPWFLGPTDSLANWPALPAA